MSDCPPAFPLSLPALSRVLRECGVSQVRVDLYAAPLLRAMERARINTRDRIGHFLSQLLHESARFRYSEEIASGSAYEGRKDLGNTHTGDGRRFKGRGLIQLTGRANYTAFQKHVDAAGLAADVVRVPASVAERADLAVESATWYWTTRNLNALADRGDDRDEVEAITRKVNGGMNGFADRLSYFVKAGAALRDEGL